MLEANSNYIKYLVELSKEGRKNSFMELCKLNISSVYALILRLVANIPLAVEITIDVYMSSWENLNHFRSDVSFSDWLKGIAVYMALEELRMKKKTKKLDDSAEVIKPDSTNKLERALFDLKEKQRVIFVLHDMEKYSIEEITDFIGVKSSEKVREELINTRRILMAELN